MTCRLVVPAPCRRVGEAWRRIAVRKRRNGKYLLRADCPQIIAARCASHRVELAAKANLSGYRTAERNERRKATLPARDERQVDGARVDAQCVAAVLEGHVAVASEEED